MIVNLNAERNPVKYSFLVLSMAMSLHSMEDPADAQKEYDRIKNKYIPSLVTSTPVTQIIVRERPRDPNVLPPDFIEEVAYFCCEKEKCCGVSCPLGLCSASCIAAGLSCMGASIQKFITCHGYCDKGHTSAQVIPNGVSFRYVDSAYDQCKQYPSWFTLAAIYIPILEIAVGSTAYAVQRHAQQRHNLRAELVAEYKRKAVDKAKINKAD